MKDDHGCLILTDIIPDWRKALKSGVLVANDLCGPYYQGYWLHHPDDKTYFFFFFRKKGLQDQLLVQILLEELAKAASISTVNSEIVNVNNQDLYGLLSLDYQTLDYEAISGADVVMEYLEYLEQNKKLEEVIGVKTIEELNADDSYKTFTINSLSFIWEALEFFYRNHPQKSFVIFKIMEELSKRYVFSFILMQYDYHLKNWEILDNGNYAFIAPLYDMDLALNNMFHTLEKNNSLRSYEGPINSIYDDFERFLASSSTSFQWEVSRQIGLFTPEFLSQTIQNIEITHQHKFQEEFKTKLLNMYAKHYQKLVEIQQRCGLKEGKML